MVLHGFNKKKILDLTIQDYIVEERNKEEKKERKK